MRLGALFGSVMLIVAVAVGYVARRADLAHSRDVQIESAATIASANLGGFIKAAEVSAAVAADPQAAAVSLSDVLDGADVCVVLSAATTIEPACVSREPAFVERAQAVLIEPERRIASTRDRLEITIVGTAATVYAEVALADLGVTDGAALEFVQTSDSPPALATTIDGRRVSATPIDHGDGLWVAASSESKVTLASEEQLMIAMLSSLAVLLLGLAGMTIRAERRSLVERASVDTLTRLPNRSEFERRAEMVLAAAQRSEAGVCLLLFDLDGFKAINDTHGHQAGDEVLRVMGKRLRRAVRESDVVARWGGDEFVLMLPWHRGRLGGSIPRGESRRADLTRGHRRAAGGGERRHRPVPSARRDPERPDRGGRRRHVRRQARRCESPSRRRRVGADRSHHRPRGGSPDGGERTLRA